MFAKYKEFGINKEPVFKLYTGYILNQYIVSTRPVDNISQKHCIYSLKSPPFSDDVFIPKIITNRVSHENYERLLTVIETLDEKLPPELVNLIVKNYMVDNDETINKNPRNYSYQVEMNLLPPTISMTHMLALYEVCAVDIAFNIGGGLVSPHTDNYYIFSENAFNASNIAFNYIPNDGVFSVLKQKRPTIDEMKQTKINLLNDIFMPLNLVPDYLK
jgi:hypothetical protein